jgi:hypothetical protein
MKAIVKLIENEPFLIVDDTLNGNKVLCEESLAWIKMFNPLSKDRGWVCEVEMKGVGFNYSCYSIYQVLNLHYLKSPDKELFICCDSNSINGISVTDKRSKATKFTLKVARALKEVVHQEFVIVKMTY